LNVRYTVSIERREEQTGAKEERDILFRGGGGKGREQIVQREGGRTGTDKVIY